MKNDSERRRCANLGLAVKMEVSVAPNTYGHLGKYPAITFVDG